MSDIVGGPLPCPFCGVEPYSCTYDGGKIRYAHEANGCIISRKFIQGAEQEAAWNRRASSDRVEQLERENAELRSELASARSQARREMAEEAAKVADKAKEMRERLFAENGASINASKAVQAEEIAAAIRRLAEQEGTE